MTFCLITFGCQMNISDSERIKSILKSIDFVEIDQKNTDLTDVIIINSCSVRESAENRVFGITNRLHTKRIKNKKNQLIIVTGCMVGRDKNGSIRRKFKDKIDFFIKIKDISNLPLIIKGYFGKNIKEEIKEIENLNYLSIKPLTKNKYQAFIPIMSGCNNFCSYCAVPYARGREQSRKMEDILNEVLYFKKNNYKEITLLGQNVNSYNPEDVCKSKRNPYKNKFAQLLWEIDKIGFCRVYFTSSHPKDLNDEVIDALSLKSIGNYLHLAVQSGDNNILKDMNRKYTAEHYLNLIQKIRNKKPDIAIGTDIIVGFPGESEEAFLNTYKLYKDADFDISYTAIYSDRSGTASEKMNNKIDFKTKRERWNKLHELMESVVLKKNKKFLNKVVSVLIEEKGKKYWIGHSSEQKIVKLPIENEDNLIGCIVDVLIEKVEEWNLYGKKI